ncbi:hypothetical protein QFC20_000251 [Naganishia adeliensis]|uniref:Uncharacterized protein n=1 Tax=Naganishia adeliensis TaxID=92952 RepID=A0ACC2X1P3_9TREE|nr:hypothetical protein QFC20_000251 [Naganishia adeliensis]
MRSAAQRLSARTTRGFARLHSKVPYLRRVPVNAVGIIVFVALVNVIIWIICGIILPLRSALLPTAALSYTLGLRHALDADHISLIDLMTRRLVAAGQRPVTVGTFFSLGHSTIVIVTSIVVAATASTISSRFDNFSRVGGIIGTSVSAAFLIFLGVMNGYVLYKLASRLRQVIRGEDEGKFGSEGKEWQTTGGGPLFRVLSKLFRVVDRPWKLYPLGVLFGLGFDTSSEIALLGISSIHGVQGTSIWLIMIFPILFTAGMCLIDTTDGGLMLTLYTWHDEDDLDAKISEGSEEQLAVDAGTRDTSTRGNDGDLERGNSVNESVEGDVKSKNQKLGETDIPALNREDTTTDNTPVLQPRKRQQDPLIFLYYSTILTGVTVIVALVIGVIQLLSLILNVAEPTGKFWDGVAVAGDNYDVIGGSICGLFLVVGVAAIFFYQRFRRWVYATRERNMAGKQLQEESSESAEVMLEPGLVDVEEDGRSKTKDTGEVVTGELLYSDRAR